MFEYSGYNSDGVGALNDQDEWDHQLANDIDFSDDEEDLNTSKGMNFKSAGMYMANMKPKPERTKDGRILAVVDKSKYYKAIEAYQPDTEKYQGLMKIIKDKKIWL
jgi:hypothetical protein